MTDEAQAARVADMAARVRQTMARHPRHQYRKTDASGAISDWAARYWLACLDGSQRPAKSIALWGSVGTGKTTAARCLADMFGWLFLSAANLSATHARHGEAALWDMVDGYSDRDWVIDDLGAESSGRHYGSVIPMAEILCARYEAWQRTGVYTHLTGNLTRTDREARYGTRVSDRLEEMTETIPCAWESFRRRT